MTCALLPAGRDTLCAPLPYGRADPRRSTYRSTVVNFAEICEFGDVGEDLYYEFLNLGYPLTASAGSDVPWGNSIGDSEIAAKPGDILHIKASARSGVVPPRYLEIVEPGRVIRSADSASAEFDLPVKSSTWSTSR